MQIGTSCQGIKDAEISEVRDDPHFTDEEAEVEEGESQDTKQPNS